MEKINISGDYEGNHAKMTMLSDGNAKVIIDNGGAEIEEYYMDIDSLSKEDIDVDVFQNGNKVDSFNDYEELVEDSYDSQFAIPVELVFIGAVLVVFIAYEALIWIEHVIYIKAQEFYKTIKELASEKVKEKAMNTYYPATISNYTTYISSKGISLTKAAARLKSNQNIYAFSANMAKSAIRTVGFKPYGPEIHTPKKAKGHYVYKHYHPGKDNSEGVVRKFLDAHALYGDPIYVK